MTVREILRTLEPVMGQERIKRLWRAYLLADATERRTLENALEAYAAQVLMDNPAAAPAGLFPPPQPETCLGDIDLGRVLYAGRDKYLFGLRRDEILRHVGIYGSSGCGKSNAIALILDGLSRHNVPFMLFDFKRTFRALLKDKPDLLVFTAGDDATAPFRFNPLIPPPGATVEVWAKKVVGALSHAYCQGAGSESLLITALTEAYAEAGKQGAWPTFADVADLLERQPVRGRKGMWADSAKRAATSVSTGNARGVFCHESRTDIGALLDRAAIVELDLLNQAEQTFLSEALLLWIIQYRMGGGTVRESLQHAIIIEEAHHLLRSPPGMGDGSEPVIHTALREVRELGESIILATQNASVVPLSVFGNQATTLAFHTKHASDVRATAQAILLKDESKDELGRLSVGVAVVRVPRSPDPIQIRLEHRPIAKGAVSDGAICQMMAERWYSSDTATRNASSLEPRPPSVIPLTDDKHLNIPETEEPSPDVSVGKDGYSPTTTPEDGQTKASLSEPTDLEVAMLRDILAHPLDGVVARIKRLAVSRRKGTAALKALEQREIVKPAHIYTGKSLLKLFDLTEAGRRFSRGHGLSPLPDLTEGGVIHRYWVNATAKKLQEQGWTVSTEHRVSDRFRVDVHATKDDKLMAVLVETGKSDVKSNIAKAAAAGYNLVLVISDDPTVKKVVSSSEDRGARIISLPSNSLDTITECLQPNGTPQPSGIKTVTRV